MSDSRWVPLSNTWLLVGVVLIAATVAGLCSWNLLAQGSAAAAPSPRPNGETRDLGSFLQGEHSFIEARFTVRNDSEQVLRIEGFERSCSCTSTELGAKVLRPGKKTFLKLRSDVRGRSGPLQLYCKLRHNQGEPRVYAVACTIHPPARFEPPQLRFGTLDPGATASREVIVSTFGRPVPPVPQVRVASAQERLRVQTLGSDVLSLTDGFHQRRTRVRVTLTASQIPGGDRGSVLVTGLEDDSLERRLQCDWVVRSLYTITPPNVFFHDNEESSAELLEATATIERLDGEPATVRRATATHEAVDCALSPGMSPNECRVTLRLNPARSGEFFHGAVVVETDDPRQGQLRIPFAGSQHGGRPNSDVPSEE